MVWEIILVDDQYYSFKQKSEITLDRDLEFGVRDTLEIWKTEYRLPVMNPCISPVLLVDAIATIKEVS